MCWTVKVTKLLASTKATLLSFNSKLKKNRDDHVLSRHQELKKYSCAECEYKSNFQMNVKRHVDTKHRGLSGDHLCSYCPKSFFSPAKLKSHILVHPNEKNFVCEECGAKFVSRSGLRLHRDNKHLNKQYLCTQCDFKSHCKHCVTM